MAAILSKQDILRLLEQEPPIIEGYSNLDEQVQPNGIDLTLREIALLQSPIARYMKYYLIKITQTE